MKYFINNYGIVYYKKTLNETQNGYQSNARHFTNFQTIFVKSSY